MDFLWNGIVSVTWQQAVMYLVGAGLIWLAVKKKYEPALKKASDLLESKRG